MGYKSSLVVQQRTAAPRARPMRRAERRQQLLEVARDIVVQDGISALTMTALTERSGASRPIVYEHFANSEAVAIALLEAYFDGSIKYVVERLKRAKTLEQYMSISIDALFEYNIKNRLIIRKIAHGFALSSHANKVYARHQKATVGSYVDMLLLQGVPKKVAVVAGYGLHEIVHSCIDEFAKQTSNSIARDTLKRMVMSVIRSVVPKGSPLKPQSPPNLLRYLEHRSEPDRSLARKS